MDDGAPQALAFQLEQREEELSEYQSMLRADPGYEEWLSVVSLAFLTQE